MRLRHRAFVLFLAATASCGAMAGPWGPPGAAAEPMLTVWSPVVVSGPTHLPPGEEGRIYLYVQNVGGATSDGVITVKEELPAGISVAGAPSGDQWECAASGPHEVVCTSAQPVAAGMLATPVEIPVLADESAAETGTNLVSAWGGGAVSTAKYEQAMTVSSAPAQFGAQVFKAGVYESDGSLSSEAGSHPYMVNALIFFNTRRSPQGILVLAGDPKTIAVETPAGLFGNPTAPPLCSGRFASECGLDSQVGVAGIITGLKGGGRVAPLFASTSPTGYASKLTFSLLDTPEAAVIGNLQSDEGFGFANETVNVSQELRVYGAFFVTWGVPADPRHDELRCRRPDEKAGCEPSTAPEVAYLTQSTACASQAEVPPRAELMLESWQARGQFQRQWVSIPPVTGCERLTPGADFLLRPSAGGADSPAAFDAEIAASVAGLTESDGLVAPQLQAAILRLGGVSLNIAGADGLAACSAADIGLLGVAFPPPYRIRFDKRPNSCSDAAKIGTVEVVSPLVENPLRGEIYLAAQGDGNPFGSLLAVYLVVEDEATGLVLKLPGEISLDRASGEVTASFRELPQIPFASLKLHFKGGSRSLLATPSTCGEFAATVNSTPWSAPQSGPPLVSGSSFAIDSGPEGGACPQGPAGRPFEPGFGAGTTGVAAGRRAPFTLRLTRKDGEQELDRLSVTLPPGLAADLRGVARCSEDELRAHSCRNGSQVGSAAIGAGAGPAPYYLKDAKVYLAGPYRGAPLSLALVLPVQAGPLDLGVEVVRMALRVDPETARITVESDPLPQIVRGIPTRIRDVRIDLDRPGFISNPTSCAPSSIAGTATGASGAVAKLSSRFQVGGCESLGFRPRLALRLRAAPPRRGGRPELRVLLRGREGDANISSTRLLLPSTELLDSSSIAGICTRERFSRRACPRRSVYGEARVWSPLLDEPLRGPVYLRASDDRLPSLALALDGQLRVDLLAHLDSVGGRIRASFTGLPDIPIGRLELTLRGGRRGLLVNNTRLCRAHPRASAFFRAHNNAARKVRPLVRVDGCGRGGPGGRDRGRPRDSLR